MIACPARIARAGCATVMLHHAAVAQNGAEVTAREGTAKPNESTSRPAMIRARDHPAYCRPLAESVSGLRHVRRRQRGARCREGIVPVRVPHDGQVAADLADQLVALRHVRQTTAVVGHEQRVGGHHCDVDGPRPLR